MKYYFFKTVNDGARTRLRPLSGQTLEDGSAVNTTLNVQADKSVRIVYPIGTIFGGEGLQVRSGYYGTSDRIYPMNVTEYKEETHRPPADMVRAYEAYIGVSSVSASEEGSVMEVGEEVIYRPRKRTPVRETISSSLRYHRPTILDDGFFVSTNDWQLLLRNIITGTNTLMVGPTGSGKTELVMLACEKLEKECCVYDMGSMYDPISGLLGVHRLKKGGESVFDYAKFTQDIQKPCVIVLDELSRAPVTTNNILFPCLDSRRMLPVELAGGDDTRNIKVHKECVFIATANVGSEYSGTMSLDRALVGRFFPIELDYLPPKEEEKVLVQRARIPFETAEHIVKVATSVRSLHRKGELSTTISTRETLMTAQLISDGWDTITAMDLCLLPMFEGSKAEGERGIVNKIIMSR